ncbi:butyrophilin subfamily 2 member A2-like [Stegastes partitus]|uniref:Butyrophilin subfamily 2 member A2-like n=1 Tax=Stegastes partitus TaxID=144197 RepID=A0A3B4ZFR0_9TELE|nr:PREDICTED: butyrophilin subfamily 2 member A2-like [Stegastes partitus]
MGGTSARLWFAVILASSCGASTATDGLVVSVRSPILVQRNHTTTLPCWLEPPQDAEDLEVRWYRGSDFDNPIMLYREKKVYSEKQPASYAGRVWFGPKDDKSGGLRSGDVSLKLENATIEDAGEYTCYVSSYQAYDSDTVRLLVTETGSPLLLSPVWKEDKRVNVSCKSERWYPQPTLRWSDGKQDLRAGNVMYGKDSSGLIWVHSWVLVQSSSEVSCSVGLSTIAVKEARMSLKEPPQPAPSESGSSAAGWVAFALLLVATAVVFAVLAAMYIKKRGKNSKSEPSDETVPFLPKDGKQPSVLTRLREYYVNIKLDEPKHKFLTVKGTMLRDTKCDDFPDGPSVTCLTAIKGTPGFSGGQHYWEVSLGPLDNPAVGLKQSWWVGVTSRPEILQESVSPNTSNGFWFLSSSPDSADVFQFSTKPRVFIGCPRPQKVGVFLDYDGGELSFYNVNDETLIGSFKVKFTGEVFPFFNPGKGDAAPMEILHKKEENHRGEEENSVDSVTHETEA